MNLKELREWLKENIAHYEQELEGVIEYNKKAPLPDLISRRVVETQIMDYRNILSRIE